MTSMALPHKSIQDIAASADPRKAILDAVGDLSGVEIFGDMVLLGIYIRPEKTRGGILRPQNNVTEDVYQGKVGLVLKWGEDAFVDPESGHTYDQTAKVGEWCVFKVGDAWNVTIKGVACRLVRDVNIKMKIADPEAVF
jgi:Chaperonin 10 Kd subunit